ncbi:MAG: DUF4886 domain-containing protein [Bacteroidota bacterium]
MKKLIICFLILPAFLFSQNIHKKVSALFLGNSYTYVNNLPLLIYSIALANGDTLVYDGNLIGGYTFNNHFVNTTSISKINAFQWDFVVLQAQSQEPAFPPSQVNGQTLPYALKLDSVVKQNNSCSNAVFYETWGRKNGDAQNCAFYPPLCTYAGMQNRLRQSYKKFADTTGGIMAPAGEAFKRSIFLDPSLELYDADQSHPSMNGSYLVACVFYEVLFQKSVLTNTYNPGIQAGNLSFLQQVAHTTVFDSLLVWNLGINLPWADFSFSQLGPAAFQFQSLSANFSDQWYFGDGTSSVISSPTHSYLNPGTYTVSHVVKDACSRDSSSKIISVLSTGLNQHLSPGPYFTVFPNPCGNTIYISGAESFINNSSTVVIRNSLGQLLYVSGFRDQIEIDLLPDGLYVIEISDKVSRAFARFVKAQ